MAGISNEERARRMMAMNAAPEGGSTGAEAPLDPREDDERYLQQFLDPTRFEDRTRRSTIDQTGMPTDIPDHLKMPGWAYAWFPTHVYGEPVEMWQTTAIQNGGWEAVPARLMLTLQRRGTENLIPANWQGENVEQGGQMLYMRPQYLDDQSRQEDIDRARRQSEGRLSQARIDDPRAPHVVQQRSPEEVFVRPGGRAESADQLAQMADAHRESARAARRQQDPMGGSLKTSADDISVEERAEIALRHRRSEGRVSIG